MASFGALLAALGAILGAFGLLLGRLGVFLDAFWRPPRLLLALLGPVRRLQHGAWAFLAGFLPKITPKELRRAILGDTDLIFS